MQKYCKDVSEDQSLQNQDNSYSSYDLTPRGSQQAESRDVQASLAIVLAAGCSELFAPKVQSLNNFKGFKSITFEGDRSDDQVNGKTRTVFPNVHQDGTIFSGSISKYYSLVLKDLSEVVVSPNTKGSGVGMELELSSETKIPFGTFDTFGVVQPGSEMKAILIDAKDAVSLSFKTESLTVLTFPMMELSFDAGAKVSTLHTKDTSRSHYQIEDVEILEYKEASTKGELGVSITMKDTDADRVLNMGNFGKWTVPGEGSIRMLRSPTSDVYTAFKVKGIKVGTEIPLGNGETWTVQENEEIEIQFDESGNVKTFSVFNYELLKEEKLPLVQLYDYTQLEEPVHLGLSIFW